ncbi:mandelate racemase/muconate lactonizing enzyme family protein [Sphingomonas sp. 37zxx]|uniref:mandelate racemase/muconate lactonizing enzyme family protein n=1 Tax=Sphingomonas sp. 37zxx TaxID=1550073 RepID=UPI00053BDA84|nr:mandelate racemase/muconate lactonizing enzyme family protein [Sphingomonas sp. 37zxx]
MTDVVDSIETFVVTLDRETPYLGPADPGTGENERGYIVRRRNGTIYPTVDRSVLVRITTKSGRVGWGETYGICAPLAVCEIIKDLLAPVVSGRSPLDAASLWDELYDLMRVRGYIGGFYLDAIAAIDIALWDLSAQICDVPLCQLLGGARRESIPAYVSGLPASTLDERVELARQWQQRGFDGVKFAAVVSNDGIVTEMGALRDALGPDHKIMIDLHWMFSAAEAVELADRLAPLRPAFIEAPVKPENIDGLTEVARRAPFPVAAGEEWRTVHDALPRLKAQAIGIMQPEMGHTGVTQFMRMAHLAHAFHVPIAPHATIGMGIFMAASLHATAAAPLVTTHEYQHSIFDRVAGFVEGDLICREGAYALPGGTGLGVRPSAAMMEHAVRID